MSYRYLTPFAAFALTACATAPAQVGSVSRIAPQIGELGSAAAGTQGIVSAADPRAADAGAEVLRVGGNATDAAIATMLALTVVEPQSSGIGGGGFLVWGDAAGHVETFDGREKAPAAATPEWFFRDGRPMGIREAVPGGRSVGVPGSIRMVALAHREHGKLAWKRLFDPAIRLARDGFAVTPRLYAVLDRFRAIAALDFPSTLTFRLPPTPSRIWRRSSTCGSNQSRRHSSLSANSSSKKWAIPWSIAGRWRGSSRDCS